MWRTRKQGAVTRREALLGGACLCCLPSLGRGEDFTVEEVASGVFMRRGADAEASAGNGDGIANIGFIVGNDAVLVTDSGGSLADGRAAARPSSAKKPPSRSNMSC